MNAVHEMLIEDEIAMCGLVTIAGIVTGAVCRMIVALRKRRVISVP
ncbi:MAG TPA: hypothetical protein VMM76_24975 [Pirellulaceae bacterium]|nr:hypothetical protein [Pirellulaceae bacterium]